MYDSSRFRALGLLTLLWVLLAGSLGAAETDDSGLFEDLLDPKRSLSEAREYLEAGRRDEARTALRAALELSPVEDSAWSEALLLAIQQFDALAEANLEPEPLDDVPLSLLPDEIATRAESPLAIPPSFERLEFLSGKEKRWIQHLIDTDQRVEAGRLLEKRLEEGARPRVPVILYLGAMYERMGRLAFALERYREAREEVALDKDLYAVLYSIFRVLYKQGELIPASAVVGEYLKLARGRASELTDRYRTSPAARPGILNDLLDSRRHIVEALNFSGMLLMRQGNPGTAQLRFQQAKMLQPGRLPLVLNYYQSVFLVKALDTAEQGLARVAASLERVGASLQDEVNRAVDSGQIGRADRAGRFLQRVEDYRATVTTRQGILRYENAENEASLQLLDRAVALDPDRALAHYYAGRIHLEEGREDQALVSLRKAITFAGDRPDLRAEAKALVDEIFRIQAEELVASRPLQERLKDAWTGRLAPEDYAELKRDLEEARRLDSLKRREPARALLRRLAQLYPQVAEPPLQLGLWAIEEGDLPRARPWLEQVLRVDPDHPRALSTLGYVDALQGKDGASALDRTDRARGLAPDDPHVLADHGWVQLYAGRVKEALATLRSAVEKAGKDDVGPLLRLGLAYYRSGLFTFARARFEEVLQRQSDHPRGLLMAGLSAAKLGQSRDAVRWLQAALPHFEPEGETRRLLLEALGRLEGTLPPPREALAEKEGEESREVGVEGGAPGGAVPADVLAALRTRGEGGLPPRALTSLGAVALAGPAPGEGGGGAAQVSAADGTPDARRLEPTRGATPSVPRMTRELLTPEEALDRAAARALLIDAVRRARGGDDETARVVLREGLKRFPRFTEIPYTLGFLELGRGRLDEARAAFETVLDANSLDLRAWHSLGDILFRLGDMVRYKDVLDRTEGMVAEGDVAEIFKMLVERWNTLLDLTPKDRDANLGMGVLRFHQRRLDEARKHLELAGDVPDSLLLRAQIELIRFHRERDELAFYKARELLERARYPHSSSLDRLWRLVQNPPLEQAIEEARHEAVRRKPLDLSGDRFSPEVLRGVAHGNVGAIDVTDTPLFNRRWQQIDARMAETLEDRTSFRTADPPLSRDRGPTHHSPKAEHRRRDAPGAPRRDRERLHRPGSIPPTNEVTAEPRGSSTPPPAARPAFTPARPADPGAGLAGSSPPAHEPLVLEKVEAATALVRVGRLREASLELQEALRIDPRHEPAHTNLLITYLAMGRLDDVERSARLAERAGVSWTGLRRRAEALANLTAGRAERAAEALIAPAGEPLGDTSLVDASLQVWLRVAEVSPGDRDVLYNLALLSYLRGETEEAGGYLDRLPAPSGRGQWLRAALGLSRLTEGGAQAFDDAVSALAQGIGEGQAEVAGALGRLRTRLLTRVAVVRAPPVPGPGSPPSGSPPVEAPPAEGPPVPEEPAPFADGELPDFNEGSGDFDF